MHINQFEIKSNLAEVKFMASHFQNFCLENQIDEAVSNRLELALVEAINNIIIHAYGNSNSHLINAKFEIADSSLCITLMDSGKEFTSNKKNTLPQSSINKELAEGNWGLSIIDSISDDVIRYRENDYNILKIIKRIN